jgi:hypothetical protein
VTRFMNPTAGPVMDARLTLSQLEAGQTVLSAPKPRSGARWLIASPTVPAASPAAEGLQLALE